MANSTAESLTLNPNDPEAAIDKSPERLGSTVLDEKQFDRDGEDTAQETSSIERAKDSENEAVEEPLQRNLKGFRFFAVIAGILSSTFLFSLGMGAPCSPSLPI